MPGIYLSHPWKVFDAADKEVPDTSVGKKQKKPTK